MAQRDWADKDYYKILGVSKTATKDEIKKAYRKLAQKHHPDANKGDAAAEGRFKEISEAHAILTNDEKRGEYDQIRAFMEGGGERFYGFQPGGQGSVRVNIGDLFGDGGIGGGFDDLFGFGPRRPPRGQDLETGVRLTFDEAIAGTTKVINGVNVRIPPGVRDGARIKVAGKGGASPRGGTAGDLYVVVSVESHPLFTQGNNGDLHLRLPVRFTEAALGAKVTVPTLDEPVTVKVPSGTQSGKTLRVRGRGAPRPGGGQGDLLVTVDVQVPTKLTKQEKQLLEQFANAHKPSPRPQIDAEVARPASASKAS
jgi:molecular chaperone DnaJ